MDSSGETQSQQQPSKQRIETAAMVGSGGPAVRVSSVWLDAWQVNLTHGGARRMYALCMSHIDVGIAAHKNKMH